jgi:ADP-ribose pyrophosphatase YjhB (NUDIX family)
MGTITKAYVIIHDGTRILVGMGGLVGKNPAKSKPGKVRQGHHFPGGTYPPGTAVDAVKRECEEETGIVLTGAPVLITGYPKTYPGYPGTDFSVSVFTLKVSAEVLDQYKSSKLPPPDDGSDDPFTDLGTQNIADAKLDTLNFQSGYNTDWFLDALKVASF